MISGVAVQRQHTSHDEKRSAGPHSFGNHSPEHDGFHEHGNMADAVTRHRNNNWVDSNGTAMAMVAVASLPKLQQFTPTPKLTAEEEEDDDGPTGPKPVLALDAKRNVDVWFPVADVDVSEEEIDAKYARLDPSHRGSIDSRLWVSLGRYIDLGEMDEDLRDRDVEDKIHKAAEFWAVDQQQVLTAIRDGSAVPICDKSTFTEKARALAAMKSLNMRERIFHMIDDPGCSKLAKYISLFVLVTIAVSSAAFVLETMPSQREPKQSCAERVQIVTNNETRNLAKCEPVRKNVYEWIEYITIGIFTVEYLLRFFTVHAVRKEVPVGPDVPLLIVPLDESACASKHGCCSMTTEYLIRTLKFFFGQANFIDFVAIAPFYITLASNSDGGGAAVVRVLRLTRVFRVFKLGKSAEGIKMLGRVMMQAKDALFLLLFFVLLGTIIFGSIIYFVEAGEWIVDEDIVDFPSGNMWGQPGAYMRANLLGDAKEVSPFFDIPRSFWWVVVTMTTVGYGDMYPTTVIGKAIGFCCMLSGVLVLAMPISIVGTFFSLEYERFQRKKGREAARQKLLKQEAKNSKKRSGGSSSKGLGLTFGNKKVEAIAKNAAEKLRADGQSSRSSTDQSEIIKESIAGCKKARSRARELAEDIAIRTQASLAEGLVPRAVTEQLQAEVFSILECTNPENPLSDELRETAVINSIELSLQLLRQMERRGGPSLALDGRPRSPRSISASQLRYLQKQLFQLSTECFLYTELERRQLSYGDVSRFSLPGPLDVTDVSDANDDGPFSKVVPV